MSFFENTRKPVGFGGKIMVAMMNLGHSPVARWGLRFLELAPDARVLDCGCGGGANIKRLLKKCPQGIVRGVDYSAVSVEKARNLNRTAIQKGRCAVWQGSVNISSLQRIGLMRLPRLKPSTSGRICRSAFGKSGGC